MSEELSHKIKRLRNEQGMTQDRFAEKCGLSRASIARYELGLGIPKKDALDKIASTLGITISDLIGEEEPTDIKRYAEAISRRPGMQVLFNAAQDAPDDVLEKTAILLEAMMMNGKKD